MSNVELRSLNMDINQVDNNELEVSGYILTNSPSKILGSKKTKQWREIISAGAFSRAIKRAYEKGHDIDFLADHKPDKILSSTSNNSLFLEEDEVGLYMRAKITATSWGKDIYTLIKTGIVGGLSFGMTVNQSDWSRSQDGYPLRTITDFDLYEISALRVPAYADTIIEARNFASVEDVKIPQEFETREIGGNLLNEEEEDFTLKKFYDGLILISEKIDKIELKLKDIEEQKIIKSLDEAKQLLIDSTALAKAQAELNKTQLQIDNINTSQENNEKKTENKPTITAATSNNNKSIEEELEKEKVRKESRALKESNEIEVDDEKIEDVSEVKDEVNGPVEEHKEKFEENISEEVTEDKPDDNSEKKSDNNLNVTENKKENGDPTSNVLNEKINEKTDDNEDENEPDDNVEGDNEHNEAKEYRNLLTKIKLEAPEIE